MNEVLKLYKKTENSVEETILYEDGTVDFITPTNKNTTKIDFVNEIKKELDDNIEKIIKICEKENNDMFLTEYNNYKFNSFDLYLDIVLMLKNNKFKNLSIIKNYNPGKEDTTIDIQKELDTLENNKEKIDIKDITDSIENERSIISFDVYEKEDFAIGETRFFSDTIDIPDNIEFPDYLEFVGQLNLDEISKYDPYNLLPKTGTLYFFQSPLFYNNVSYDFGKVIYVDSNNNFTRKNIKSTEDSPIINLGIRNIKEDIEKFSDRYKNGNQYSFFAKEELNKIYGFFTDCQKDPEDIKKISNKYIVLLQLGSEVYGEGVTTFLISKEDLKNKNFEKIIFRYAQS